MYSCNFCNKQRTVSKHNLIDKRLLYFDDQHFFAYMLARPLLSPKAYRIQILLMVIKFDFIKFHICLNFEQIN